LEKSNIKTIDFLIPCHPKDFPSLIMSVNGIKKNISSLNKIFVVSCDNPNIEEVIHIPEERYYSFIDKNKIKKIYSLKNPNLIHRSKWIYQQFLKLYSAKVVPELTDSYVIVDADTIFLNDVSFDIDKFYFCKAEEYHKPYLEPIKKLLDIEDTIGFSTICHHMIFNKQKLNEMISIVEKKYNSQSFFDCVLSILDYAEASCMSEWDLYSNYMILNYPEMCAQRQLNWTDIHSIPSSSLLNSLKDEYDFVSCHAYLRGVE